MPLLEWASWGLCMNNVSCPKLPRQTKSTEVWMVYGIRIQQFKTEDSKHVEMYGK